jgi:hypothetical protein
MNYQYMQGHDSLVAKVQIWSMYRVTPLYQMQSTLPTSFESRLKNDMSVNLRGDNFIPDVPELPSNIEHDPRTSKPPLLFYHGFIRFLLDDMVDVA